MLLWVIAWSGWRRLTQVEIYYSGQYKPKELSMLLQLTCQFLRKLRCMRILEFFQNLATNKACGNNMPTKSTYRVFQTTLSGSVHVIVIWFKLSSVLGSENLPSAVVVCWLTFVRWQGRHVREHLRMSTFIFGRITRTVIRRWITWIPACERERSSLNFFFFIFWGTHVFGCSVQRTRLFSCTAESSRLEVEWHRTFQRWWIVIETKTSVQANWLNTDMVTQERGYQIALSVRFSPSAGLQCQELCPCTSLLPVVDRWQRSLR